MRMRECVSARVHWVLCLKGFIYFLKSGILGKVSGEHLNRIFISFPGVSFSMLINQNEHKVRVVVPPDWSVLGVIAHCICS